MTKVQEVFNAIPNNELTDYEYIALHRCKAGEWITVASYNEMAKVTPEEIARQDIEEIVKSIKKWFKEVRRREEEKRNRIMCMRKHSTEKREERQ